MKALGLAVLEAMSFEAIVDDARRTTADGNSSPGASGSGELKRHGLALAHLTFCLAHRERLKS